MPIEWAWRETSPDAKVSASHLPAGLQIAAVVLRVLFIACLLVITLRVSMPQSKTIWTAYETPGDFVRMALGFAVCVWIAIQLFRTPKGAHAYRTWLYFGLAAVPFSLICLVAVW
jgi:archaellum biogenesis protein FlaJ (TadC family)